MLAFRLRLTFIVVGCFGLTLFIALATPLGGKLRGYFIKDTAHSSDQLNIPAEGDSGTVATTDGQTIAYGDATPPAQTKTSTGKITVKKKNSGSSGSSSGSGSNSSDSSSGNSNNNNGSGNNNNNGDNNGDNNNGNNNNPTLPVVNFSSSDQALPESAGTVMLTVGLSSSPDNPVTIPYSITGSATGGGTDYTDPGSSLTIPAHVTSGDITFQVINHNISGPDKTVVFTLQTPTSATLGTAITNTVTITYNDSPPACSRLDEDNSIWINAGIQQAIADGQTSYYLPACTYRIDSNIQIPYGTSNFKLYGAGKDKTVFVTPNVRLDNTNAAITVGMTISGMWGVPGQTRGVEGGDGWLIQQAHQGDTTLTIKGGQQAFVGAGKAFALWDETCVTSKKAPWCIYYTGEIVHSTGYNPDTGVVTLDIPIGRDYSEVNKATLGYASSLNKNITIQGLGFDGKFGDAGDASFGFISANLVENLTISDVRVKNFSNAAIQITLCRNVNASDGIISDASSSGAGAGYGFSVDRSRFGNISNWQSIGGVTGIRHGIIMHAGAVDYTTTDTEVSGFDSHGMNSRRILLENCRGNSDISLGNAAWLDGDEVTVDNCTFNGGTLSFSPYPFIIENSHLTDAVSFYSDHDYTLADVEFLNDTFDRSTDSYYDFLFLSGPFGKLKFDHSTFAGARFEINQIGEQLDPSIYGPVEITNSAFNISNPDFVALQVSNGAPPVEGVTRAPMNLTFNNNTITYNVPGSNHVAVNVLANAIGTLVMNNNTLVSPAATNFYWADPATQMTITQSGNQIVRP
ncbi:MAG TPA: hypothetical protein VMQ44_01405 [Candidatus Saccharimonadales bacterium]|nr:hypothetical protein [Candidatus Saccharimonadales bacterium]